MYITTTYNIEVKTKQSLRIIEEAFRDFGVEMEYEDIDSSRTITSLSNPLNLNIFDLITSNHIIKSNIVLSSKEIRILRNQSRKKYTKNILFNFYVNVI